MGVIARKGGTHSTGNDNVCMLRGGRGRGFMLLIASYKHYPILANITLESWHPTSSLIVVD